MYAFVASFFIWIADKLVKLFSVKSVKIIVFGLEIVTAVAFYTFVISQILLFYNHIKSFLENGIVSSSSSDVLCKFWGMMSCLGITEAFSNNFSLIVSALVFTFSLILYKEFVKIHAKISKSIWSAM